jgi:hypothetical protein
VNLFFQCDTTEEHADIVLMLDISSSMSLPTAAGRWKVEAVVEGQGLRERGRPYAEPPQPARPVATAGLT